VGRTCVQEASVDRAMRLQLAPTSRRQESKAGGERKLEASGDAKATVCQRLLREHACAAATRHDEPERRGDKGPTALTRGTFAAPSRRGLHFISTPRCRQKSSSPEPIPESRRNASLRPAKHGPPSVTSRRLAPLTAEFSSCEKPRARRPHGRGVRFFIRVRIHRLRRTFIPGAKPVDACDDSNQCLPCASAVLAHETWPSSSSPLGA
jgi:hypothetical protein